MNQPLVLIGNYSTDTNPGSVASVALGQAGRLGARLSAIPLPNPSFVATAGNHVLAVLEEEAGALTALPLNGHELGNPAWTVPSGGPIPCHLAADGDKVGVAHYGDGTFALHTLAHDGDAHLSELSIRGEGSGPIHPDQDNSRAHFVLPWANGYLVSDLGADRVYFYEAPDTTTLNRVAEVEFPAGTGPRHLAIKDHYLFVSGELDSRLHLVELADPQGSESSGDYADLMTYLGSEPSTETPGVRSAPSHLALDAAGEFLYFANRFRDTIAVFDVRDLGSDGLPMLVGEFDCGGHIPRHFAIHESKIYIANQGSDSIDVFDLLPYTGFLGTKVQSVDWQAPSCLVFTGAEGTDY